MANDVAPGDAVLARVAAAVGVGVRGDRPGARLELARLWAEIGPAGDALHRCAVGHAMADVQDDPAAELEWDLRALDAAAGVSADRAHRAGLAGPAEGLLPSLHLNAGESYRKVGNFEAAGRHLRRGRDACWALAADGYADQVRRGLDGLADRLAACVPAVRPEGSEGGRHESPAL